MKTLLFGLLFVLPFFVAVNADPALAASEKCRDQVVYDGLAVEGVLKEHGSADGYYVDIDLTPQTTADQIVLSLSVQDSENTRILMDMAPGVRIRVAYDMVREYDSVEDACIVYGVVRKVEELPSVGGK